MTAQATSGERFVQIESLRACLERALEGLGVPDDHAEQIAEVLLDAELRGYDDHGVFFLGELAKWFRSGALNPAPDIRVRCGCAVTPGWLNRSRHMIRGTARR